MRSTMPLEESRSLHTPVVALTSPLTKMCQMPVEALDQTLQNISRRSQNKRLRREHLYNWMSEKTNPHVNAGTGEQEREDAPSDKKRLKITNFATELNKVNQQEREILSLQVQKAMIADEDGDRPIHIAVAQEKFRLVEKLCFLMKTAGTSLDLTNHLRQTPLHIAAIVGNAEIAKILLRNGASLHCQDRHGCNAILLSVKYFNEETLTVFLDHVSSKAALDSFDYDGFTALHYAVDRRNAIAVNKLCQAGADVNAVDGKSGRSCLAHAVLAGHLDMVKLLLHHKARIDRTDYSGQNALELALHTGNRTVIHVLEKEAGTKQEMPLQQLFREQPSDELCSSSSSSVAARKRKKRCSS